ncbi:MAG: TIGR01777 family oxidoreductase [Polyangiaceae bacterium]
MSGASGPLGEAIADALRAKGYRITTLVRRDPKHADEIRWDPSAPQMDGAPLEGAAGIIHLSGENVAEGRWSDEKKRRIIDSRVQSTSLLAKTIAGLSAKPGAFLSASAIGYYGSARGDDELTESSSNGDDFLADVCARWERASEGAGVRTVNLRFGLVLTRNGGALGKLLPLFKRGLGGRVGSGKQVMSWISGKDAAAAVVHALETPTLSGPVNVVAPRPVTNQEFTEKLAKALGKGTALPVPAFVLKVAYGQMGVETVLASQRVVPQKLLDSGFEFTHDRLLAALRDELEVTAPSSQ